MAGTDRSAKNVVRLRRQFQKLTGGPFIIGDGLEVDDSTVPLPTLSVKLDTNVFLLHAAGIYSNVLSSSDGVIDLLISPTQDLAVSCNEVNINCSGGAGEYNITTSGQMQATCAGDITYTTDSSLFLTSTLGDVVFTAASAVNLDCSDTTWNIVSGCSINAGTYTISALGFGQLLMNGSTGVTLQSSASNATAQPLSLKSGSPTSGANSNAGTLIIRSGQPRGTGTSIVLLQATNNAGTVNTPIKLDFNGAGFFGAVPIGRQGTYTITACPATALAINVTAATYTGIDNLQVGTVYAKVADLNTASTEIANLASVLRQVIKHLGDTSGFGLLDETAY